MEMFEESGACDNYDANVDGDDAGGQPSHSAPRLGFSAWRGSPRPYRLDLPPWPERIPPAGGTLAVQTGTGS